MLENEDVEFTKVGVHGGGSIYMNCFNERTVSMVVVNRFNDRRQSNLSCNLLYYTNAN